MLAYNAKIWNSGGPDYTWMTFDPSSGYITDVGVNNPPVNQFSDESRIDYKNRRIIPGLHESHIHVTLYGKLLAKLNLEDSGSIAEFLRRLAVYSASHPEEKWVIGRGWEQDSLGRYPTREDLDSVCSDRPVFLVRVCGHIAVVNSRALKLAGIDRNSTDPPGGAIERYPEGHAMVGEPTGLLLENTLDIINELIVSSSEEKLRYIRVALAKLLEYGVTSAHACEDDTWNEFCRLSDAGELPIRIFFSAYFESRKPENFPFAGERRGNFLSCDRVKIFADGALGASTAALSQHYCNSSESGMMMMSEGDLTKLVREATASGYRLEIHVIGDKAAETALDSLAAAKVAPEKRPILTHCQILRADLLEKMRSRGVVANIQPQFVNTDARWLAQLLPEDLMEFAYPWKSLLERGIACAGGSDAPVEEPRPLVGMHDAIFRQVGTRGRENSNVYHPDQRLTVREALDLYTKDGAYATMQEHRLGQLLPGFQADFVVLDVDICDHPEDLLTATPDEVWVAGVRRL